VSGVNHAAGLKSLPAARGAASLIEKEGELLNPET
jgi:hypothetical protein